MIWKLTIYQNEIFLFSYPSKHNKAHYIKSSEFRSSPCYISSPVFIHVSPQKVITVLEEE